MNKVLGVASVCCALLLPYQAHAQVSEWKAIVGMESVVTSIDTWGFITTGSSEERARKNAHTGCENSTGRTCKKKTSSSVPVKWYLVVSVCDGVVSTGGSQHDEFAANTRAGMKLGHRDGEGCSIAWIFPPGCTNRECGIRR